MSHTTGDLDTIVLSDIHLGADLVQHARPWTRGHLTRPARVDGPLTSMLRYVQRTRDTRVPLRVVLAGDVFELVGMSILPSDVERALLAPEDLVYGLGRSEAHTIRKFDALAARHSSVLLQLASLLDEGVDLVLLPGNHDADLFWPGFQRAFIHAVANTVRSSLKSRNLPDQLQSQIRFMPWFYFDRGLYVEHGHLYDSMSARKWFCWPGSPDTPSVTRDSLGDVLIRQVVNPTPGMSVHGHEHDSFVDWFRFLRTLGIADSARLVGRIVRSCGAYYWREHRPGCTQHLAMNEVVRANHERLMRLQSELGTLPLETLAHLAANVVAPASDSIAATLRALRPIGGLSCVLLSAAERVSVGLDGGASIVAMGHTHVPIDTKLASGTRYVNLGSWGGEEADQSSDCAAAAEPQPATYTFLWAKHRTGGLDATLYRWTAAGPEKWNEVAFQAAKPS